MPRLSLVAVVNLAVPAIAPLAYASSPRGPWALFQIAGWPAEPPTYFWVSAPDLDRARNSGGHPRLQLLRATDFDQDGAVKRWVLQTLALDCRAQTLQILRTVEFGSDGHEGELGRNGSMQMPALDSPEMSLLHAVCYTPTLVDANMPSVAAAIAETTRRMRLYVGERKSDGLAKP